MNKNQKIILIVVIVVLIITIGLTAFFTFLNRKEELEPTTNTNENVIKDQTIEGLKIDNVMLLIKEEGSTFTANITNTTKKEIKGKRLEIIFKTSNDKKVASMLGYFGDSIKPEETKQINTSISRKLNKNIIKSVEYKINTVS